MSLLDGKVPPGAIAEKWEYYKSTIPLVSPNNKRRLDVIVVGTGLAGASAAATLGELGL
jgi:succinate dehydrogenase / fumarate reductase flavoprotein subunit